MLQHLIMLIEIGTALTTILHMFYNIYLPIGDCQITFFGPDDVIQVANEISRNCTALRTMINFEEVLEAEV